MTPVVVTIAGSDSGGGAGIQADLKTFGALGVYGTSVITALTAQNTQGVTGIHEVPTEFVVKQIDAIFSDFDVGAVKIGMLPRAVTVRTVAAELERRKVGNIVLDPVLVATSTDKLVLEDTIIALRNDLIPLATVVTPNLPEAAALTGATLARNEDEMAVQGRDILTLGARYVLVKGGHSEGRESVDLLIGGGGWVRISVDRIATENTHGTGCTLSSAIAAGLAKGREVVGATQDAKAYVTAAIANADRLSVGHGHGPLNHFYKFESWRRA